MLIPVLCVGNSAKAQQNNITGCVVDKDGEPIPGATLRLYSANRTIGFGVTNEKGEFSIGINKEVSDSLRLVINGLGYSKKDFSIKLPYRNERIVLSDSPVTLKEVVVKAPDVKERGDTTSFRLHAFASKRDITLEEGLKKLPGIEVSSGGTISYLGRNISNFFVEGLQLAGSRYNQITRNLPSEYVTDVELIENFNEARVDSGRQSDNVAMNIRLNSKVRFRPVGTAEAGMGIRSKELLYTLGATGMFFAPSFQTMLTIKGGNIKEYSLDQSGGSLSSGAKNAIGNLSGDLPPLLSRQYKSFNDKLVSVNAVKALTKQQNLNANAYYAFSRNSYDYENISSYFTGDNQQPVVFKENYSPLSSTHRAGVNLDYSSDRSNAWFSNKFSVNYEFQKGSLDAGLTDGERVFQSTLNRIFRFSDDARLTLRKGKKRYSLSAGIRYSFTPFSEVKVTDAPPDAYSGIQKAYSHLFDARLSSSFDWLLSANSSINFPIEANLSLENITTCWNPYGLDNDGFGNQGTITIRPTYEIVTDNRKVELSVGVGMKMLFLKAGNRKVDLSQNINRMFLSPLFLLSYKPTSRLSLAFSGNYDEAVGDITELLVNKIMRSFRNSTIRSGVIARWSEVKGSLEGRYSNLMSLWFTDLRLAASRRKLNTIGTTEINGGQISSGNIAYDNYADVLSASAGVSKHVRKIGLRVGVRGMMSLSKSQTVQQEEHVTVNNELISISPVITFSPLKWFEIQLDASWSQSISRYLKSRRKITGWNNEARISFFPVEILEIFGRADCITKHDDAVDYPTVFIFDAGVNLKVGKVRLSLNGTNLLNKKHFYYSVFNEVNTFNYDFRLQPRALTLSVTFTM